MPAMCCRGHLAVSTEQVSFQTSDGPVVKIDCFGDVSLSQGWMQRAISVGETTDVTRTEYNHPPGQASNKAKKLLVSSMRKGQYSLTQCFFQGL